MKVIDQINGSALFAQSAYSAAVATKDELGRDITATYLTAHQSLEDYATTSDLEQVSAEVTDKLDVTAQVISSCETSSIDGETLVTKLNGNEIAVGYAASARIANIALKDYQGNSFVPFYAKTSALEEKLDTTAFSDVSGSFLTAVDLSNYYTKDETSGKEELADAFANIPVGDPEVNAYVTNNSASIDGTSTVVQSNSSTWSDITAYQSNSASYLTAHQDLSAYQTTAGMVDYQTTAGMSEYATTAQLADKIDYSALNYKPFPGAENLISGISGHRFWAYTASNSDWANAAGRAYKDNNGKDITATYLTTTATANFATTGDLALKQDTLTFGYDEQDRINSINSSALAGGGDIPEDVMVETNLEYNAVNEISGYNGSAIAQYGAEKQWLVHDDTLVHAANSTQYALGVAIDNVARLMGVDETVLWSGTPTSSISLSEPFSNFESIKIDAYAKEQGSARAITFEFPGTNSEFDFHIYSYNSNANSVVNYLTRYNVNGLIFSASTINHWWQPVASVTAGTWGGRGTNNPILPIKVVGVHRISG